MFLSDEEYNLGNVLEPYLKYSEVLKIEDPYLPNTIAIHNLKGLINLFSGKKIFLKTHSEENYRYDKNETKQKGKEKRFDDFQKFILTDNRIEPLKYYQNGTHFERYIYTDSLKIKLPGGLDFLNTYGKISSNVESVEVEVSKLQ